MADDDSDDTVAAPAPGPTAPDATRADLPPVDPDATRIGAGERAVPPAEAGPSGTSVLPAVPVPPLPPPAPPKWSARAQVPTPGQEAAEPDWEDDGAPWDSPPQAAPRSWGPVLIGLLVLVLLAVLAFGLWLALRGKDTGTGTTPTDTAPVVTTPATTAGAPTTAAQSTAPPTTQPAGVPIPNVANGDYGTAAATLQGLGLQTRRGDQTSATVPAGTVIGTDPAVGVTVPVGAVITILVSTGPPPTTPPPATNTPSPTATP